MIIDIYEIAGMLKWFVKYFIVSLTTCYLSVQNPITGNIVLHKVQTTYFILLSLILIYLSTYFLEAVWNNVVQHRSFSNIGRCICENSCGIQYGALYLRCTRSKLQIQFQKNSS